MATRNASASAAATIANLGTNVRASLNDGVLTLQINLKERHGPSASGKTTIIATSSGNKEIPGAPGVLMGLNIYTKSK